MNRMTRGHMRYLNSAAIGLALSLTSAFSLHAQKLTAHRQFLSLEPYYASTWMDSGGGANREMFSGYGARLWINLAPFSGPPTNLIGRSTLSLFTTYQPDQKDAGFSVTFYGAEIAHHFIDVPVANLFDPFFVLGIGDQRTNVFAGGDDGIVHRLAVAPGLGLRIPIPNRLQLRLDAKDILTFPEGADGKRRTLQSVQATIGAGLTF